MSNVPPEAWSILVIHALIGAACLYFGFTIKHRAKWLLIFIGGLEVMAVVWLIVAAGIEGARHPA